MTEQRTVQEIVRDANVMKDAGLIVSPKPASVVGKCAARNCLSSEVLAIQIGGVVKLALCEDCADRMIAQIKKLRPIRRN
jgi:hypothetical protein